MKTVEKSNANINNQTKVLSLQNNYSKKDYYMLKNSKGNTVFLLDEYTGVRKQDYYTVYYNWDHLISDLSCHKTQSVSKYRWWSYCPSWTVYKPGFIHEKFKAYFNEQIVQSLKGLKLDELTPFEKNTFKTWMRACKRENPQMALFN